MFIESPNMQELRQGDIFTDLYFPFTPCESPELVGTAKDLAHVDQGFSFKPRETTEGAFTCVTAQVPLLRTPAMLMSQCCDVAFENRAGKIKRRYLVIAPLTKTPPDLKKNEDDFEALTQNPLDRFLNYFYVPKTDPFTTDYIADFSRVVSLRSSEASFILRRKVLQMTDEMRVVLKLKFSFFFGRTVDEAEDKLANELRAKMSQSAAVTPD